MTTEDEVMHLLRRADPDRHRDHTVVINGTDYLAVLPTMSTTVTLVDSDPTPTPTEGRHRWPIVTVAAAAVVVVVGVGALVLSARGDSEPQGPADSILNTTVAPDAAIAAEEIARGFFDAYVANDADRALSYLSDDAIAAGPALREGFEPREGRRAWESAEEFRRSLAWNEAAGYTRIIKGCERINGGTDGVTVRCDHDVHALGSDALGLGPFPAFWDVTVRGGKIVANEYDESPTELYSQVWDPFARWISTEHPADVAVMYTDSSEGVGTQATTDEALRLWEQRTGEYVQAVLTGPQTYAADVAAICATQAAQLAQLTVPAEGALDQVATWNTAAAAILQQTRGELNALDKPPTTDTAAYSDFHGQLIRFVRHFEATADAATAGNSTPLNELDVEYPNLRQGMTSGPAGSGLEECLDSIPTSAMSGTRAP